MILQPEVVTLRIILQIKYFLVVLDIILGNIYNKLTTCTFNHYQIRSLKKTVPNHHVWSSQNHDFGILCHIYTRLHI